MISEDEYWNRMLVYVVLIFTTYPITNDLINEKQIQMISYFGKTISAVFYAGIVDVVVMAISVGFLYWLKKRNQVK